MKVCASFGNKVTTNPFFFNYGITTLFGFGNQDFYLIWDSQTPNIWSILVNSIKSKSILFNDINYYTSLFSFSNQENQ